MVLGTASACTSVPTAAPTAPDAGEPPAEEPDALCRPPAQGTLPVALEPAFNSATFAYPVDIVWARGETSHAYVVEAVGTVRRAHVATGASTIFLDVRHHFARHTGDLGLWDIAFHPRYPMQPYVFAFLSGNGGPTDFRSLLLRYTSQDGGMTIDQSSEEIVMSIDRVPGGVHAGGRIAFGGDGMLWISTGDGDGYGDPLGRAQDPYSLLGKMLRLDVDSGVPYAIPSDNPFALGGAAPEVYALGFRNPWRWSFDRMTGDVWVGDVGHERFEEIDRIVAGGNYGWATREAFACWAATPCDGPFIDPVYAYGREVGTSVIGGFVYRGNHIPALSGRYVFGDNTSGRIWALFDDGPRLIAETGNPLAAFGEDPEGEILVTEVAGGRIARIVPSYAGPPGVPAPWLFATNCLTDPRLVAYDVNAPLWSDGLDKERRIVVPKNRRAEADHDGDLHLPGGTVLVKTFRHEGRPIETRLLVREEDDGPWSGWSYRWLPDGSNAMRIDDGGSIELDDITWHFPSTAECARCHTAAAGHALGFHLKQLDRGTQLAELQARGVLDVPPITIPPLAGLDATGASLESRARSYLHANCSMCHRPGGSAQGDLDLRIDVSLADTNACDRVPMFGTVGISDGARVIAPGFASRSVLLARMATRGDDRMPPLATSLVDAEAVHVVAQWIASLSSCW